MKKYFNIAGPCNPDKHYMILSESRCKGIKDLIEQEQYFVIHAARQSGKTTLLLDLTRKLNDEGRYHAMYCSLESAQGIIDPEKGIPAVFNRLAYEVELIDPQSRYIFSENTDFSDYTNIMRVGLSRLCSKLKKPMVILFDEADCLSNGTLISFLRQLRDGYVNRNRVPFVHSVGLIGMRNIRDYKGKIREDSETLGSASPFNIVTKVMTLRDFTKEEVSVLYDQHTEVTGQVFSPEVIDSVYHQTQGQPWLVNAVVREIITEILDSDYSKSVTPEHVGQAVETIIQRRDTHVDSLLERLKEERVMKVVEPVLTGKEIVFDPLIDDFQYVLDLGLLKKDGAQFSPSNPIYADVMIRYLGMSESVDNRKYHLPLYISEQGLDMKKLLTDFQMFWRDNSAIWEERFLYKEAAPHLILTAFLQRVINSGGRTDRELATGRKRLDLCIHYQNRRYPIEIKIRQGPKTYDEGKKQLSDYMDTLGCDKGWLVVFDRRKKRSWKSKLFWKTGKTDNKEIYIVGC
jgi:AAA-like domain